MESSKELRREWTNAASSVIESGVFIKGNQVNMFEKNWSKKLRIDYSLGVSNGQDGLIIALQAVGVEQGDLVVVPAHSFIATHNAIISIGAIPYSIDVNIHGLIDVSKLNTINEKIKAIIVVHMHGKVCDMNAVLEWTIPNNIAIIEDCSQSHLAVYNNQYAGTFGDIGVFSLYPTKNLGALGDAGIVVTNNLDLFKKMYKLSNYGTTEGNKYDHLNYGLNHRLDEMQAAFLNINLHYLESWNQRRREIAKMYFNGLALYKKNFLQEYDLNHAWHHFCLLVEDRNNFRADLQERGVETEIHYPNVAATEAEKILNLPSKSFPIAFKIASETLSLPISPWHSNEQIEYVISSVNKIKRLKS